MMLENSDSTPYIISSVAGKNLRLPEHFEFNNENSIVNKHNTKLGYYIQLYVVNSNINLLVVK
ncbi:hypothetical protein D3C73_904470 [compost metagenome]